MKIPFSSVGYLTYKRTYSRVMQDGTMEEFEDTIDRVLNACADQLDCGFTTEEENRFRGYLLQLKGTVAGRALWQLGTTTVDTLGLDSLQNCAFTVIDEPVAPFCWCMNELALGAGVGVSVQRKHVSQLPPVKPWFEPPLRFDNGGADFIVPDSREGWVKLLGKTLKAAFLSEAEEDGSFTFSTQVIRSAGEPIKGFGGKASGPGILCTGISQISDVLYKRRGKQLRPIDAHDIICIIGSIIVAGNIRRSAIISLGDPDDVEFLLSKSWYMGNIPSWRAMANNSVICDDIDDLHDYFWKSYEEGGESIGLINLGLARKCGRLGDTQYQDPRVEGVNPCSEQSLEPYETCMLADLFLPNITSKEELFDLATMLYRVCKHTMALPSGSIRTETVVHSNMRMGIGVSGYLQATEEQRSWLSDTYKNLRIYDKYYSASKGFPLSIKLTCCKPSGTVSLLPGITPGCHPAFAQYMYRRIRLAATHDLVDDCRRGGYPVEYLKNFDGSEDHTTVVVTFPFAYPEGTVLARDLTAIDQIEVVTRLQREWADNAISCTVYYKEEELPAIKRYLKKNYKKNIKCVSFLRYQDNDFIQQPYEEITKEQYEDLVSKTRPIVRIVDRLELSMDDECAGGNCAIR